MELSDYLPIWGKLTSRQQSVLRQSAVCRKAKKGSLLQGTENCLGLLLVCSGQLRAYILSEEGREITMYRLFQGDICLFSASCMLRGMQLDVAVEVEKDTAFWTIPAAIYKELMEESAALANYTNEIMSSRFSQVMWLLEQVMWKSLDRRLADFLLRESALEESPRLALTHERIANHLGTAREVVTRMLRYFQEERLVKLARGIVEITDEKKLRQLAGT